MKHHDPDAATLPPPRPADAGDAEVRQAAPIEPRTPAKRASRRRTRPPVKTTTAVRWLAIALIVSAPAVAVAQDYGAMIQQQMNAMNQTIARGQQQVNQIVQQRMQDPQVQAAYRDYVARSGGRPAMDYPTFTYNYVYTNGFSAQGIAHARANEAGIAGRERAAVQGLRDAEANRGAAQQAQRDGYFRNQQEAGRGLMGQGTYVAPNGAALQLPHTWQPGTVHQYQGQTYGVDASGQYHVLGSNGWWYAVPRR